MGTVQDLRVEYQQRPLAIQVESPRFSWTLSSAKRDVRQTSYRIVVHAGPHSSQLVGAEVWDSGRIDSSQTAHVRYEGDALPPGETFSWRLEVTASGDSDPEPSHGAFETAPDQAVWSAAEWITHPRPKGLPAERRRVPYLRKRFGTRSAVIRARVHATAGGVYFLSINGARVSDALLAPGWTDYRYRVPFHTYDVTDLIRPGDNMLGAVLSDGWYSGFLGPFDKRNFWGEVPVFRAVLVLSYDDGSTEHISTDLDWQVTFGPIQGSDLLHGEYYDARLHRPRWSSPDDSDSGWSSATIAKGPAGHLVSSRIAPVGPVRTLPAVGVTEPLPGTYIVDFGQNFAGHVRIKAVGPAGSIVQIRHGELLNADGTVYTDNLRSARATDTVVLGDEAIDFEPSFTYHGFRYAEVTGYPGRLHRKDITGIATSSVSQISGAFHTDNELLNRFQSNIEWGILSNFIETPHDCPQRDERLGWGGDAHVFAPTAVFNADLASFFAKWLDDIRDAQKDNGSFADIAPCVVLAFAEMGSPGYADAGVFVPWLLYQTYGDIRVLEDSFESCCAWLEYIHRQNPDLIWRHGRANDYGDWLSLDETDKSLVGTAYWARAVKVTAACAEILGREAEHVRLNTLHVDIATAFQREYITENPTNALATQCAYVLALDGDLLGPEQRLAAAIGLARDIDVRGHATTGFLSVSRLLPVLSDIGRTDLCFRLLLREDSPSWGYQVSRGLTTFAERWNPWTPDGQPSDPWMNSYNHFVLGSFGEWLYSRVGGLSASRPGYESVHIEPIPGPGIGTARTSYQSIRGPITVDWRLNGPDFTLTVDVPANVDATVILPGYGLTESGSPLAAALGVRRVTSSADRNDGISRTTVEIGSGTFEFRSVLKEPNGSAIHTSWDRAQAARVRRR